MKTHALYKKIISFFLLTFFGTGWIVAQNNSTDPRSVPKQEQILYEKISGFTISKSSSDLELPFRGGIDLEVKVSKGLMQGKAGVLTIVFSTDSWVIEKSEIGSSFFQEIRGYLESSPGVISLLGTPKIFEISNSGKRLINVEKENFKLKDIVELSEHASSKAAIKNPNLNDILPFQIPLLNTLADSMRVIELIIPLKLFPDKGSLKLCLDKIVFSEFAKKKQTFADPVIENLTYDIIKNKKTIDILTDLDEAVASTTTTATATTTTSIHNRSSNIDWQLQANLDQGKLMMILDHSSSEAVFIGIRSMECIMKCPSGSILFSDNTDIFYSDNDRFLNEGVISNLIQLKKTPSLYTLYSNAAVHAFTSESIFDEVNMNQSYNYSDFLEYIWKSELQTYLYQIPIHRSQKNYPLHKDHGKLSISLPTKVYKDEFIESDLYIKINYLYGDSKTNLKIGEEILKFEDFLK